jgi:hypothetical protein
MYLEKFLGLNRDWLDKLSRGDYAELESFRENRENILNILKHLDALIETHSRKESAGEVELAIKKHINALLNRKDALVKAILSQDLEIMELIENAKSQIIIELKNVQKGRKTIGSYKSFNRKETVDEEA